MNFEYVLEDIESLVNIEKIKQFLNFPDIFWDYICPKIRLVDSRGEKKHIIYETIMHFDENDCLDDMRVFVPKIIDLSTALINVHEFKHAYDLFNLLGKKIDEDITPFEESASKKEEEFKKYLLTNKKI